MLSFLIVGYVCFLWTFLICCDENATVMRLSVPEDHHVCLRCGDSDTSDVIWTHQDRRVLVTKHGDYETNEDQRRYLLPSDGGLCLLQLDEADGGEYRCNQQLVAELQVLTGVDFLVSSGRTLLVPCSSSKLKQRWFHRRAGGGGRKEAIFTRFRNGTVRPEGEENRRRRLSFSNDALQINNLQQEDDGEYQCNGNIQGRVTVQSAFTDTTSEQTSIAAPTSAAEKTDEVETKKKKKSDALVVVTVVCLALMIVLSTAVCVLLTSLKCRRKRKRGYSAAQRRDDTELQLRRTSGEPNADSERQAPLTTPPLTTPPLTTPPLTTPPLTLPPLTPPPMEDAIHYASLGRQNWKERPCRTPDQDQNHVIYSAVVTRSV